MDVTKALRSWLYRGKRWMYRGKRPQRVARLLNGMQAKLAARGIGLDHVATLEVAGRRSGKTIAFPVVVADYQGERYLVSMLGETANWVRNVRATGGAAVLRHGGAEFVRLEEVAAVDRPPILRRYLDVAPGARPHVPVSTGAALVEFEKVAAIYPVFHIAGREI
jgi:hypothetical protein